MIYGIGVDLVQISRIARALSKFGDSFLDRVFTEGERAFSGEKGSLAAHFAVRFAAKEAFLKALGSGKSKGIRWKEVEIVADTSGRPRIELRGEAKRVYDSKGLKSVFLSLAHEKDYGVAVVVVEA